MRCFLMTHSDSEQDRGEDILERGVELVILVVKLSLARDSAHTKSERLQ